MLHHLSRRQIATVSVVASAALASVALSTSASAETTNQGPSSSATPYLQPADPSDANTQTLSLLTTPDRVPLAGATGGQTYQFNGTPDGVGAFDNGDGTYTALINHEFGPTVGSVRSHGSTGAYVSRLVVRKSDNTVVSGEDLIKQVFLGAGQTAGTTAFSRFCSADLPAVSAFFNQATGLGTAERIFMNGEESGPEGRAFGHVATGPDRGKSYELPALGKFSWENSVANPATGNTTAVAGTDDASPGQVYIYLGTKKTTGSEVDKAGLTGGELYGVRVPSAPGHLEDRSNGLGGPSGPPSFTAPFDLADLGDRTASTGAQLDIDSDNANVTEFLRPEDFAWDADDPTVGYFATTDRYDQVKDNAGTQIGRSRLWKLDFSDINNLPAGGTITAVIDGTEINNMLDNFSTSKGGKLLLQEDVGNQAHNGKVLQYDAVSDSLKVLLQHDPARFGDLNRAATAPFNQDEESSGMIDVSDIYGAPAGSGEWFLFVDQAHSAPAPPNPEAVENGQFLLLHLGPDPFAGPNPVIPEVPLAVGLPIVGIVVAGAVYLLRRRADGSTELA